MRFRNKVAIVTGAGNGIGLAIARTLAAEGASLVVADINAEAGERAAAALATAGGQALAVPTEIGRESCRERV